MRFRLWIHERAPGGASGRFEEGMGIKEIAAHAKARPAFERRSFVFRTDSRRPFPPTVANRLLVSALTAAIEWLGIDLWR